MKSKLETVCPNCKNENSRHCYVCFGFGYELTNEGRYLLEFMKRWLKVEDRNLFE